jgi:hypothetical protein
MSLDDLRNLDMSPSNAVFIDVQDDADTALRCAADNSNSGCYKRKASLIASACLRVCEWRSGLKGLSTCLCCSRAVNGCLD